MLNEFSNLDEEQLSLQEKEELFTLLRSYPAYQDVNFSRFEFKRKFMKLEKQPGYIPNCLSLSFETCQILIDPVYINIKILRDFIEKVSSFKS